VLQVLQSLYDLGSTQDPLGGLLGAVFILYHILVTDPFLSKLVLVRQWEVVPHRSLPSLNSLGPGKHGSTGQDPCCRDPAWCPGRSAWLHSAGGQGEDLGAPWTS